MVSLDDKVRIKKICWHLVSEFAGLQFQSFRRQGKIDSDQPFVAKYKLIYQMKKKTKEGNNRAVNFNYLVEENWRRKKITKLNRLIEVVSSHVIVDKRLKEPSI